MSFDKNAYAWRLTQKTPRLTARELELHKRNEKLREAADSAIADSLEADRERLRAEQDLLRSHDVEVVDDHIETARRLLTPKETRVFEALRTFSYSGTFQQLRDARPNNGPELWEPSVLDESIETVLKRLRKKLPAEWWFEIHNDFTFTWDRRPDEKNP